MAAKFWVGGTGNWSDTTHWSLTTGGAGSAGVPSASEDATFDALSNALAYTVTVDTASTCLNLTMGAPLAGKVTFAGTAALTVSGNLNFSGGSAGITMTYSGSLTMNATSGTKTLTSNETVMSNYSLTFNGIGGTFQLADNFAFPVMSSKALVLTNGTFDPNGKSVTINCSGSATITGAFTFYDFIMTNASIKTTFAVFSADIIVTHTISVNGASSLNRIYLQSTVKGTQRKITITGTTGNSYSNVDFQDINLFDGAGQVDLSAISGGSGDAGGNNLTNMLFTSSVTQYFYLASGNANWSAVANWYLATGGTGGAGRVPLPQDDVVLNADSFDVASQVLTQDMPRAGRSITWANVTNTPTWTTSTAASIFGSLTLDPNMILTASTQLYTFEGRSAYLLTNAGLAWAKGLTLNAPGGSLTMQDALTMGATNTLTLTMGTFSNGGGALTLTAGLVSVGTGGTFTGGSATHLLIGVGTVWTGTGTITAGTYTLKITDTTSAAITFAGGGKTYPNLWFARGTSTGTNAITGTNTFNELKDDGSIAHTLTMPNVVTTVTTFTVSGVAGQLISLIRTGASGSWTLSKASGIACIDYVSISNGIATGGATFSAGSNSTNGGGNTGWGFGTCPNLGSMFLMF